LPREPWAYGILLDADADADISGDAAAVWLLSNDASQFER
jgi:hypothetical protein